MRCIAHCPVSHLTAQALLSHGQRQSRLAQDACAQATSGQSAPLNNLGRLMIGEIGELAAHECVGQAGCGGRRRGRRPRGRRLGTRSARCWRRQCDRRSRAWRGGAGRGWAGWGLRGRQHGLDVVAGGSAGCEGGPRCSLEQGNKVMSWRLKPSGPRNARACGQCTWRVGVTAGRALKPGKKAATTCNDLQRLTHPPPPSHRVQARPVGGIRWDEAPGCNRPVLDGVEDASVAGSAGVATAVEVQALQPHIQVAPLQAAGRHHSAAWAVGGQQKGDVQQTKQATAMSTTAGQSGFSKSLTALEPTPEHAYSERGIRAACISACWFQAQLTC